MQFTYTIDACVNRNIENVQNQGVKKFSFFDIFLFISQDPDGFFKRYFVLFIYIYGTNILYKKNIHIALSSDIV